MSQHNPQYIQPTACAAELQQSDASRPNLAEKLFELEKSLADFRLGSLRIREVRRTNFCTPRPLGLMELVNTFQHIADQRIVVKAFLVGARASWTLSNQEFDVFCKNVSEAYLGQGEEVVL